MMKRVRVLVSDAQCSSLTGSPRWKTVAQEADALDAHITTLEARERRVRELCNEVEYADDGGRAHVRREDILAILNEGATE